MLGILKLSGVSKLQTQFHGRPTKAWSLVTANDNQLQLEALWNVKTPNAVPWQAHQGLECSTTSCILEEDCMILGHQLSTEAEAYPELSRLTFAALKQRCCNTRLSNQGSSVWRVMTQIAVNDRVLFLA